LVIPDANFVQVARSPLPNLLHKDRPCSDSVGAFING
jgi:hypothetical protein